MSETTLEQFRGVTPLGRLTLQNSAMLKVSLQGDQIQAKLDSMVAYQGDVRFEHKGGGIGRFFKKAMTGEGTTLMTVTRTGEVFLAHDKEEGHDPRAQQRAHDRERRQYPRLRIGHRLGHPARRGRRAPRRRALQRRLAGHRQGRRDLRRRACPARHLHPDSAIAWSGNVRTSVRSDVSFKTFIGKGSGETFQIAFEGAGWVLIQPSEGPTVPPHSHGNQGGGGGLGSFFED